MNFKNFIFIDTFALSNVWRVDQIKMAKNFQRKYEKLLFFLIRGNHVWINSVSAVRVYDVLLFTLIRCK